MSHCRDAEDRYESCQKQIGDRDTDLDKLRDEFQNLNDELNEMYRQKKRYFSLLVPCDFDTLCIYGYFYKCVQVYIISNQRCNHVIEVNS